MVRPVSPDPVTRRAPRRGRYDRRVSPEQRRADQHARLLDATTQVLARDGERATATSVVHAAGVGRNTFYEHFASIDAAIEEISKDAIDEMDRELRAALAVARTPIETLRVLGRTWIAAIDVRAELATGLLRRRDNASSSGLSHAGELFRRVLDGVIADARDASAITPRSGDRRILAMSAAAEVLALEHLAAAADDAELLSDLLVRAFR